MGAVPADTCPRSGRAHHRRRADRSRSDARCDTPLAGLTASGNQRAAPPRSACGAPTANASPSTCTFGFVQMPSWGHRPVLAQVRVLPGRRQSRRISRSAASPPPPAGRLGPVARMRWARLFEARRLRLPSATCISAGSHLVVRCRCSSLSYPTAPRPKPPTRCTCRHAAAGCRAAHPSAPPRISSTGKGIRHLNSRR